MYKITPIKVGECINEGPRVFYLGDCSQRINLYNIFWVLQSDEDVVLVDTGFDGEFATRYMPDIKQGEGEDTISQLKKMGINPEDVTKIILTHLHFDHFSDTAHAFKNANVFVQKKELDCVISPRHPWFAEFVDLETIREFHRQSRFILVEGDVNICKGISVILTGGHTPGHQSVVVDTNDGKVILLGDISITYENIEKDIPVGFNSSLQECFDSMKKLRNMNLKYYPGHDSGVFNNQ